MKHVAFVGALLIAFGGSAGAQSLTEKTGVNSVFGISPSTPDFVKRVALSDLFEIQSSELAKEKSSGPVKAFAEQMIQDHTKTSNELKAFAANGSLKVDIPSGLDDSHQKKLDALKEAEGRNLAGTYVNDQVDAHKDAVDLFERYAKGGDNETLKQWVSKTLPTLKSHLEMAEGLNNAGARRESEKEMPAKGTEATGR